MSYSFPIAPSNASTFSDNTNVTTRVEDGVSITPSGSAYVQGDSFTIHHAGCTYSLDPLIFPQVSWESQIQCDGTLLVNLTTVDNFLFGDDYKLKLFDGGSSVEDMNKIGPLAWSSRTPLAL